MVILQITTDTWPSVCSAVIISINTLAIAPSNRSTSLWIFSSHQTLRISQQGHGTHPVAEAMMQPPSSARVVQQPDESWFMPKLWPISWAIVAATPMALSEWSCARSKRQVSMSLVPVPCTSGSMGWEALLTVTYGRHLLKVLLPISSWTLGGIYCLYLLLTRNITSGISNNLPCLLLLTGNLSTWTSQEPNLLWYLGRAHP